MQTSRINLDVVTFACAAIKKTTTFHSCCLLFCFILLAAEGIAVVAGAAGTAKVNKKPSCR